MSALRRHLAQLAAPLAVFVAVLAVLQLQNASSSHDAPRSADVGRPAATTDGRIAQLQRVVRVEGSSAAAFARLGEAYLQKARESADPSFYTRAQKAFDAARRRQAHVDALVGAATLANVRHDFRHALRLGQQARRVAPEVVRADAVVADALIELGRYDQAARTLQRVVDRKPTLAGYARVSYYRELSGDLDGAVEAMRLAVSAGAGAPENLAYVQALLGDLELQRGRPDAAEATYLAALANVRSYAPGEAGLARVELARGRLRPAIRRLERVTRRLPLTTHLILLAEAELASGDRAAAAAHLEVVRAQQRLLRSAGARPDAELVLFEANHGDPRAAVRLGWRVWRDAPSVRSADALGWALTRAGRPGEGLAWARRAVRLGSRDPSFRFHLGASARAAGRPALAQRELRQALAGRAALSPLAARQAEEALR
jgi:tetratricopeptide (TPR) repeat protein